MSSSVECSAVRFEGSRFEVSFCFILIHFLNKRTRRFCVETQCRVSPDECRQRPVVSTWPGEVHWREENREKGAASLVVSVVAQILRRKHRNRYTAALVQPTPLPLYSSLFTLCTSSLVDVPPRPCRAGLRGQASR